jgi:mannose/fructose/N-acetylgalactosamine-specific phosphotransferase system component IIC
MDRTDSSCLGVVLATLLAGPIFMFAVLLGGWLNDMGKVAFRDEATSLPIMMIIVLVPSIIVGACISVLPNMIGTGMMEWLGRNNPTMRRPIAWAIAGGLSAGIPFAMLGNDPDNWISFLAIIVTGVLCALICRWPVVWDEDL